MSVNDIKIKICGLCTKESVETVVSAGADFAGFVHCAASPRHLEIDEIARLIAYSKQLNRQLNRKTETVVLLVNPDDELIDHVIKAADPHFIQLHGQETPQRVADIREQFPFIRIIKAIGISTPEDIALASHYDMADMLLLDAKPPKGAMRTGGHGAAFDWALLKNAAFHKAYLLAGGLTPENVAQALFITNAEGVDVSSGVEDRPGIKSHEKIREFIENARGFSDVHSY